VVVLPQERAAREDVSTSTGVEGDDPEARQRDRTVQAAAKLVLEPIFEADLDPSAYGYRPNQSATTRCRAHVTYGRIDGTIGFSDDGARAASQAAETIALHDIVVCRHRREAECPVIGASTTGSQGARAGGAALLTTGETPTVTVSRQAGPDASGGAGSLIIDPIVSEWAVARGGNSVAPPDGVRPHRALQSPIDDGRRVVSRRAPRPARGLTGRSG